MKQCKSCGVEKHETDFYSRKGRKQGYSLCKPCFNRYLVERWKNRKKEAIEYKGGKCQECGYERYYGALEFHHRDPSIKDMDWNKMRLRKWSLVIEELDKCDLLCSNCHREKHGHVAQLERALLF